ncbi:photosynthetic reaction center subunit H [Thalassococcus sp. BH17M4-6]|uniref:photosynthetic reaction center subunit H n=1 Tax=Thalassococcus sp. BH17M4-6 TaxID=3413148 RepID=UPI003BC41D9E
MTEDYILGNLDIASIALWLFFFFFVALVVWIQRENQREGYPLVDEDGSQADAGSVFPNPADKTFRLPHGQGEVTVPSGQNPERADIAMAPSAASGGFPFEPTGNPMADGVGPASWANRKDLPELDGKGHPKIVPMSAIEGFAVSAGRDPRGLPVVAGDGAIAGKVVDMWIDEPEQLVRYLEVELEADIGTGTRLIPMTLARIWGEKVLVKSIYGEHFGGVPKHAAPRQVTKLEEDKISGYYGGGHLYAGKRQDSLI